MKPSQSVLTIKSYAKMDRVLVPSTPAPSSYVLLTSRFSVGINRAGRSQKTVQSLSTVQQDCISAASRETVCMTDQHALAVGTDEKSDV